MATLIPTSPTNTVFFFNFETGNTSHGISSPFVDYTSNHDTNYKLIRDTLNQLIVEVNATNSQNSPFNSDVVFLDDPTTATGAVNDGVVGVRSLRVSIGGDTTTVDVEAGTYAVAGLRGTIPSLQNLAGAGLGVGAVTPAYIAIDAAGVLSVESLAAQTDGFDIASVNWDGADFTGSVTQVAEVFIDGDAWRLLRHRTGHTVWATELFTTPDQRIFDIEALLEGSPPSGIPGIGLDDGAGTAPSLFFASDTELGLYKPATDKMALVGNNGEHIYFDYSTTGAPRIGIDIATPLAAIDIDGLTHDAEIRLRVGGAGDDAFVSMYDSASALSGAVGYDETSDLVKLVTGAIASSTAGVTVTSLGQVSTPDDFRICATTTGAFSLPAATWTPVGWDSAPWEVGDWGLSGVSDTTLVVPAGGDGLYGINILVTFISVAATASELVGIRLVVESVVIANTIQMFEYTDPTSNLSLQLPAGYHQMDAGDVIEVEVYDKTGIAAVGAQMQIVRVNSKA